MAAIEREAVLARFVERIVHIGHPLAVILFGSSARGDARPDSDLDLLVIERAGDGVRHRGRLYRMALRPRVLPLDILVMTPEEVRAAWRQHQPVIRSAIREGRWLYGSPGGAGIGDLGG